MSDKDPTSLARRFLGFCVAVLAGTVLLYLAIQLLSQFWGWLALLGGVAAATWIVVMIVRARRNRW